MPKYNVYDDDGDVVELGDEFFEHAKPAKETNPEFVAAWEKARREGTIEARPMGRPKSNNPKKQVTVRLDAEVIAYFKSAGKGWQTRLNAALQEYIQSH